MKKIILGVVALALAVTLTGCGLQNTNQQQTTKEPIKIGSILILTGDGSSWGNASKNGIDMAIEKINSAGGINGRMLQVSHQDTPSSDAKTAVSDLQALLAQGINIIIGPNWSNSGLPLIDLAEQNKVLMISPSLGKKEFNEGSQYLFNTWPHDFVLSAKLADYAYGKGQRKVAIIGAKDVWVQEQTDAFKKRFEELGGRVVIMVEPNPTDTNLLADALKIKNAKGIDAIISTTDGVGVGAQVMKKVKELGVKLPLHSVTIDENVLAAAKGSYEGMEFYTSLTPTPEFKKAYEDKYKTNIDIGADSAYDAVMMIAQAMKVTKSTDTTILANFLVGIKEYKGVSGDLISDGKRGFTKDFVLKKVVDGKIVDWQ
jgi:branched-chain amino acid transport system substrate-binding protein